MGIAQYSESRNYPYIVASALNKHAIPGQSVGGQRAALEHIRNEWSDLRTDTRNSVVPAFLPLPPSTQLLTSSTE